MDIDIVREAVLLLGLGAFAGIVGWAYRPGRKSRFERAAVCVFEDDEHDALSVAHALARRPPAPAARALRRGEGD